MRHHTHAIEFRLQNIYVDRFELSVNNNENSLVFWTKTKHKEKIQYTQNVDFFSLSIVFAASGAP